MRNATMLYKAPGTEPIHGTFLATTIVDADEDGAIAAAQAEGWFLTTPEAVAAYESEKTAVKTTKPVKTVKAAADIADADTVATWSGQSDQ